ncbi:MAG: acetyl-CoA carboxylase biotin carboxylase subunit [Acidobacteria bacterium]|nr:acetyl-CoA carboxylase biotin carboxylase subunit [Acidobacteriota bacterium]MBI3421612.1 acetyl-CoA carboxylase biotin carboxylase subunit [Acidobacteriota bacterium]
MFRKILIANRGEIAVRLIRACRDMGISPVAVYSEADRHALHVRLADEAYFIGAAPSAESYLVGERVIDAAKQAGAEGIHPGYGFLSEREWFARAVEDAGITFIGPAPATIELMGDKINAREAALRAGAPIVPGTTDKLTSAAEARRVAGEVGYPVMLKAAAGGGGKGMRVVRAADEMNAAFQMASSEAQSAFGDPAVYVEKFIEKPRHIEIQIAADRHGNVIHLGERECSIQRRHQKVIEECPASFNDAELRARMGAAAVEIARAANYYSVGTVEFLVDAHKNFYFLEMNTRLQVEHPVTELVTGVDLVREQIRIAAGERLGLRQEDVRWTGSALECRVYAEDPAKNFLPSPGRITRLRIPSGPGVRDDSGVYEGWEVPIYYDPMISKLATWGATRAEAIARMQRALGEYHIGGIRTTIPFFRAVLEDEEFKKGEIDTGYIARFLERNKLPTADETASLNNEQIAAALAAAFNFTQRARKPATGNGNSNQQASRWKQAGRAAALNNR